MIPEVLPLENLDDPWAAVARGLRGTLDPRTAQGVQT
jgi:hypothetical protein